MHFNNITRLYGSIYTRLPCKLGKKAACLREGDYEAGHAITHVQMHVQSTVSIGMRKQLASPQHSIHGTNREVNPPAVL